MEENEIKHFKQIKYGEIVVKPYWDKEQKILSLPIYVDSRIYYIDISEEVLTEMLKDLYRSVM